MSVYVEPFVFPTLDAALDYQIDQGGWVYVVDDQSRVFWFSPIFSAFRIMTETPAKSLSGRLIADPLSGHCRLNQFAAA